MQRWTFIEHGRGRSRTFRLVGALDADSDLTVEVLISGHVETGPRGARGVVPPTPIYLVRVWLPTRGQGERRPSQTWRATHVLRPEAGEWLLATTIFEWEGVVRSAEWVMQTFEDSWTGVVRNDPPDRVRRAASLDRHRHDAEWLLRQGHDLQLMRGRTSANDPYPDGEDAEFDIRLGLPDNRFTTLNEIAFEPWAIDVPHTTRGRIPTVDPVSDSTAASTRKSRIAKRSVR